jgi:hypothetical protein
VSAAHSEEVTFTAPASYTEYAYRIEYFSDHHECTVRVVDDSGQELLDVGGVVFSHSGRLDLKAGAEYTVYFSYEPYRGDDSPEYVSMDMNISLFGASFPVPPVDSDTVPQNLNAAL